MRKFFAILLLVIITALAYLGYAHFSGGALPLWELPLGGQRAKVRAQIVRFFEKVRFKNNKALADFVEPGTEAHDLENFLLQTIDAPLSAIDLQAVAVDSIELDSGQERARARVNLSGQNLRDNKFFDITKIIFLYRVDSDRWLLDIKNSNR
jgi:hypothetical protein